MSDFWCLLFPAVQRTFDFIETGNCLLHVAFWEFPAVKKHQMLTGGSKSFLRAVIVMILFFKAIVLRIKNDNTRKQAVHRYNFISRITCEHGYKEEDFFNRFSLAKLQWCISSNFSVVFLLSPQILCFPLTISFFFHSIKWEKAFHGNPIL